MLIVCTGTECLLYEAMVITVMVVVNLLLPGLRYMASPLLAFTAHFLSLHGQITSTSSSCVCGRTIPRI